MLVVADREHVLVLSPARATSSGPSSAGRRAVVAIGSGAPYAVAAARALLALLGAPGQIAEEAMKLAAEICICTNANLTFEEALRP